MYGWAVKIYADKLRLQGKPMKLSNSMQDKMMCVFIYTFLLQVSYRVVHYDFMCSILSNSGDCLV